MIVPGFNSISVISSEMQVGNPYLVLEEIASRKGTDRISRAFSSRWSKDGKVLVREGKVTFEGREYSLILKAGVPEGLFLRELKDSSRCSMKPLKDCHNGCILLGIGDKIRNCQLCSYANMLVACWVVHGKNWLNCRGESIEQPYGCSARIVERKQESHLARRFARYFRRYDQKPFRL